MDTDDNKITKEGVKEGIKQFLIYFIGTFIILFLITRGFYYEYKEVKYSLEEAKKVNQVLQAEHEYEEITGYKNPIKAKVTDGFEWKRYVTLKSYNIFD